MVGVLNFSEAVTKVVKCLFYCVFFLRGVLFVCREYVTDDDDDVACVQ